VLNGARSDPDRLRAKPVYKEAMKPSILILGATGVFGRRLAAHLARTGDLRLLVSSRRLERSSRLAGRLRELAQTKATIRPIALDVNQECAGVLKAEKPAIVVDCSGPFQAMDYTVAEAVCEAGSHFVDLADARGYLTGFGPALDRGFRQAGLVALAGASSSPALAAAAVASLSKGWRRVREIEIAIVPGGQSEVGEAAVAAALSYCGRPVPIVENGRLENVTGWGENHHVQIEGVGRPRVSPVETSDAELLQQLYPEAERIRFWAGLESGLEHWGLRLLSTLRRRGLPGVAGPLERHAAAFTRARSITRLMTGDTGGMVVRVAGTDMDGADVLGEWRLVARNNEGPHVPPSPAATCVRAILAGRMEPGARPALDLELGEIEREFAPYAIETAREVTGSRHGEPLKDKGHHGAR
jgi:saccharopine dehydrogenase-like NADP-dependent oxidoreductase